MQGYFLIVFLGCLCFVALDAEPSDSDVAAVAKACNQFSFDLLKQVQEPGANAFFSSYSICTALAMVLLGARGNTAKQIKDAFHYDANQDVYPVYQKLVGDYNDPTNPNYTLSTANRLYGANDFKLNETYQNEVKKYFLANLEQIDFTSGTAEGIINEWVANETRDKIQDLFPKGSLSSDTKLVLANAIYFKGNWEKQFDTKLTKKGKFIGASGKNLQVDMMYMKEGKFAYQEDSKLDSKVLEMAYSGGRLSMIVVLPNQPDGLNNLIKKLSAEKMASLMGAQVQEVDVKFPKFKIETSYELVKNLNTLKITDLFTGNANLSGISKTPLKVSQVRHKAFVMVDEKGTEAAAATGVGVVPLTVHITPSFFADHPFYFAIVDKSTKFILFSGVVNDPTK